MTGTEALGVAAGIVLDRRAPWLAWIYPVALGGFTSHSVLVDFKVERMEAYMYPCPASHEALSTRWLLAVPALLAETGQTVSRPRSPIYNRGPRFKRFAIVRTYTSTDALDGRLCTCMFLNTQPRATRRSKKILQRGASRQKSYILVSKLTRSIPLQSRLCL
jgi:hypothetical protein